jgi:hypothetical protein
MARLCSPCSILLLIFQIFPGAPGPGSWTLAALPETRRDFRLGYESLIHHDPVKPLHFPVLSASGRIRKVDPDKILDADLRFRVSPSHPAAHTLSSRNFHWGDPDDHPDTPLRVSFGRRQTGWSALDTLWNLGEYEPLDQWDRLRPSPQGLTGLFAFTETHAFHLRMFLTGIFLPEASPNVVLRNGRFAAEHPQSITTAPQTINLLNRPTPMGYRIESPTLSKVLIRPGFAVSMETKPEQAFHSKFAYAYLPLNHFPVALQAELSIPLDQVEVTLRPRLLHHHLYSADLSVRSGKGSLGLSALVDEPVADLIRPDETATPLTTSTAVSPWFTWDTGAARVTAAHLWIFGGIEPDRGPYASPDSSLFSSRILYRNASQLTFLWRSSDPDAKTLSLKVLHEWSIRGRLDQRRLHLSVAAFVEDDPRGRPGFELEGSGTGGRWRIPGRPSPPRKGPNRGGICVLDRAGRLRHC